MFYNHGLIRLLMVPGTPQIIPRTPSTVLFFGENHHRFERTQVPTRCAKIVNQGFIATVIVPALVDH